MPKLVDRCLNCGMTYEGHISNTGAVYPCWVPIKVKLRPEPQIQGWTRTLIPKESHNARAYNVSMQQQPRTEPMYKFGVLRFTHSESSNGVTINKFFLPLLDTTGKQVAEIHTADKDLTETLVELLTIYDIEPIETIDALAPPGVSLPVSNDWDVLHVDYHEDHDGKEEFSAGVIDGDSGAMQLGYGMSVLDAVADLARNLDFKTRVADNKLGLRAFLDQVAYGLERHSNEVLMSEMEGIILPEKGAW